MSGFNPTAEPMAQLFSPTEPITPITTLAPVETGITRQIRLLESGLYQIRIREQGDNEAGSYNLALQRLFPPPLDAMSLCVGCVLEEGIEAIADSDVFVFEGNLGDIVELTLTDRSLSGFNPTAEPMAQLYGPDQKPVLDTNDNPIVLNPIETGQTRQLTLLATGTYTILVREQSDNEAGSYNLALQRLFPPPLDARFLCLGCGLTDAITPVADSDVILFDGTSSCLVELTLTDRSLSGFNPTAEPIAQLYGPDQKPVLDTNGATIVLDPVETSETTAPILLGNGTYTILVREQGDNEAGNYSLSLQRLSGNCSNPRPEISVSTPVTPLALIFSDTSVGSESAVQTVTVRNDGGANLNVGAVALNGGGAGQFILSSDGCSNRILASTQSCTLEMKFAPTSLGLKLATLRIPSNDTNENPVFVELSGNLSQNPPLEVCSASLDFGSVVVNSSQTLTCAVTNNGTETFTGNASVSGNGFSLVGGGGLTLPTGQTQVLTLQFAPTLVGAATGGLTITGSSSVAPSTLKGVGQHDAVSQVSPTILNFGGVPSGQNRELTFTVTNIGTGTLGCTIQPPANFDVFPNATVNLGADQSQTYTLRFTPPNDNFSTTNAVTFQGNGTSNCSSVLQVSGSGEKTTASGIAYVVNRDEDTVSVVDTGLEQEVQIIPVGQQPVALALTPNGSKAYVVNKGANTVSVIDTATLNVVKTPSVGPSPEAVVVTPDGRKVFVANRVGDSLSIIDVNTDTVVLLKLDVSRMEPAVLRVSPDSKILYVLGSGDHRVSVVEIASNQIGYLETGLDPIDIAFSLDGRQAYVANRGANTFTVLANTTFPPSNLGNVSSLVGVGAQSIVVNLQDQIYVAYANGRVSQFQPNSAAPLTSGLGALSTGGDREVRALFASGDFQELPLQKKFNNPALIQTSQGKTGVVDQGVTPSNPGTFFPVQNTTVGPSVPLGNAPVGGVENPLQQQQQVIVPNSQSASISLVSNNSAPFVPVGPGPIAAAVNVGLPAVMCSYTVTGLNEVVPKSGGNRSVTVQVIGPPQCRWRVEKLDMLPWVTLQNTGRGGTVLKTGNGQVQFSIAPNPGLATRGGRLRIGGQIVNISQAGDGPRHDELPHCFSPFCPIIPSDPPRYDEGPVSPSSEGGPVTSRR
ncbi:MAG: choice-of-anchor D domain-containing protein [Candidatus Binatia bacterium]